jgi:Ca2+-binding EF-hand superfamily protein
MNIQINELINNMKDERKRIRQKAVEQMLKLIQENAVQVDILKNAFLGKNPDLTSSVIQIVPFLCVRKFQN